LTTTEALYWFYWFAGEEFQDEVGVVINTKRLKRIAESCFLQQGGDDKRALVRLVPRSKLLLSNSQIDKLKPHPQLSLF